MTKEFEDNKERVLENPKEMSFFDHLEEFRWHLFRSVIAVMLAAIVAFFFKDFIFNNVILMPKEPEFISNRLMCRLADLLNKSILCINQNPVDIINIKITGQFVTHITISFIAGFLIAFPYVVYQIWTFIRPGLYKTEKKTSSKAIFAISILFILGVCLGYFVIVPLSLNFLSNYVVSGSVENKINLNSYMTTMSSICFAAGIVFELPVLTYFLTRVGALTPHFMRQYRKHAIVVILILSAVLTPPDLMSQMLIGFPLYLLYELSIRISTRVLRKMAEKG